MARTDTYIVIYSASHLRVCARYENVAVEIRYDEERDEWAVGYAPRDGWWPTKAEAIDAAKGIVFNEITGNK